MTFKNIKYLLNLLLAVSLSLKAIAVSAQTSKPVGDQGGGSTLLPTGKVITPTAAPGSTVSLQAYEQTVMLMRQRR